MKQSKVSSDLRLLAFTVVSIFISLLSRLFLLAFEVLLELFYQYILYLFTF